MSYIKVEGHENIYRDPQTGAIVNSEKPQKNQLKQRLLSTEEDLNSLTEEIKEIKLLLLELTKKNAN